MNHSNLWRLVKFVIVYIANILIYSNTIEQHIIHVHEVLSCLLKHQLFIKAEKCSFHQTTILFLGYVINEKGVEMDNTNVKTIMGWPTPSNIIELQRLLGFVIFYQYFIRGYSSVAAPYTNYVASPEDFTGLKMPKRHFEEKIHHNTHPATP